MATYVDPQLMASALAGGMPSYPPVTPPSILDKILPGINTKQFGGFGGVYDDTPTFEQQMRDSKIKHENWEAGNTPNTVIPPEAITQDKMAGKVLDPSVVSNRSFHPSDYMPPAYGMGRNKIYTPNYAPLMPPTAGDAVAKLIEKLSKKK